MRFERLLPMAVLVLSVGCASVPDRGPQSAVGSQQEEPVPPPPAEETTIPAAATAEPEPEEIPKRILPEVPALDADAHLAQGVAALQNKESLLAAAHLRACTERAPDRADCQWELGWAWYLLGDWEEVVAAWEAVKRLQPTHPDVDGRLEEARGQVALRQKLEAMALSAPDAVRAPVPEGTTLRLRAVGDVMLGSAFPEGYLPPNDGAHLLDGVKDLLFDADLTFINLEGPLCDTDVPSSKCKRSKNCYAFRTPTSYGAYLKDAGVDVASTANNHSGDFGEPCRRQTEAVLDSLGIAWSGPPGSVATLERNGMRIAVIAFHTSPACNDVNDTKTAVALVQAAAASHDLVVVSFHGGAEGAKALHVPYGRETFFGENRGDLRKFTHAVVDAGADLVIGHGPHVLRGMEIYRDRLIAYSLGNFATYGRFNLSGNLGISVVLETILDREGRFLSGKLVPTKQLGEGIPHPDPSGAGVNLVRMLSSEDFPGTAVIVDREGNLSAPSPGVSLRPTR